MSLAVEAINPDEVRAQAAKFEDMSLTEILQWTWENYGTTA